MPDVNLTYESFKKEHTTYFRVAEILSNHYFNELSDVIYLNIDLEDLNILFQEFLGDNENGLNFLVKTCLELLASVQHTQDGEQTLQEFSFSDATNFYQPLIDLTTKWEQDSINDPHPALPFVALFITVATQMGERELSGNVNQESEPFDFRNFYGPLYNTLGLSSYGKSRLQSDTYFKRTFSDEGLESYNLFKKFSDCLDSKYPSFKSTFKTSDHRRHQDWILNQALINSKDIYELADFFKYSRIIRDSNPDKNLLFTKLKDYLKSKPIKAKSFSKSIRNYISIPEFTEIIASIIKIKFDNWDGESLSPDKGKQFELFHKIEIDNEQKIINNIKGEFNLSNLEDFNLEEFKIKNPSAKDSQIDVFKDETSDRCFIESLNKIYFESTRWKVDSPNLRVTVATYLKKIMVFQLDESQTDFNPNPVWKEVNKNETLRSEETYIAVCEEELVDTLLDYLNSNSEYLDNGDYSYTMDSDGTQLNVVRDIRLNTNRSSEGLSEYLEVFSLKERESSLIELTNGLMSSERIYLFNELPDIIIPKEYINEYSEIKLSINGSDYDFKISADAVLYSKEYSYILDKETEEVEISYFFESSEENVLNYKDSVKFFIKNPTYINDINAGKMAYNLQYDFVTEKVNWKSYFPDTLLQDARENGYLSGGQFNIPSIKYENKNSLDYEKKEFSYSKKTEKLIFIGRNPLLLLQYSINESSENWMDNFQKHKNLYLFGQEQVFNDGIKSSIQLGSLNLEEFQPFHEMKKKIEDDFTWVIRYNSNLFSEKIKIFQIGKKSPKGLETSDNEELEKLNKWKNIILEIKEQINSSEITLDSELDIGLWNKYIEKAEML
jgi:hypothetical protein